MPSTALVGAMPTATSDAGACDSCTVNVAAPPSSTTTDVVEGRSSGPLPPPPSPLPSADAWNWVFGTEHAVSTAANARTTARVEPQVDRRTGDEHTGPGDRQRDDAPRGERARLRRRSARAERLADDLRQRLELRRLGRLLVVLGA